jgi:toxin ParE1/3/4
LRQYRVIFAPEARDDLFALYDWITAAASPDTALSYIERIETYCLGFTHAAERGTRRDDIRPGGSNSARSRAISGMKSKRSNISSRMSV